MGHKSSPFQIDFSSGRMILIALGVLGLGLAIAFGGYILFLSK